MSLARGRKEHHQASRRTRTGSLSGKIDTARYRCRVMDLSPVAALRQRRGESERERARLAKGERVGKCPPPLVRDLLLAAACMSASSLSLASRLHAAAEGLPNVRLLSPCALARPFGQSRCCRDVEQVGSCWLSFSLSMLRYFVSVRDAHVPPDFGLFFGGGGGRFFIFSAVAPENLEQTIFQKQLACRDSSLTWVKRCWL